MASHVSSGSRRPCPKSCAAWFRQESASQSVIHSRPQNSHHVASSPARSCRASISKFRQSFQCSVALPPSQKSLSEFSRSMCERWVKPCPRHSRNLCGRSVSPTWTNRKGGHCKDLIQPNQWAAPFEDGSVFRASKQPTRHDPESGRALTSQVCHWRPMSVREARLPPRQPAC